MGWAGTEISSATVASCHPGSIIEYSIRRLSAHLADFLCKTKRLYFSKLIKIMVGLKVSGDFHWPKGRKEKMLLTVPKSPIRRGPCKMELF